MPRKRFLVGALTASALIAAPAAASPRPGGALPAAVALSYDSVSSPTGPTGPATAVGADRGPFANVFASPARIAVLVAALGALVLIFSSGNDSPG